MIHQRFFYGFVLAVSLAISACGGSGSNNNGDFDDLRAFSASGPYSSDIADCVRASSNNEYCPLSTLPLLGQDVASPTVDDIMKRLVISHDWMALRFEQVLNEMPAEMLPLFKGLTAVVIDDDIRPAYYTSSTGAIYLDPIYLWVEAEEKQTINPKEDHRAGFDDPLNFRSLSRYIKDGRYAYSFGSLDDNNARSLDDVVLLLSRLLLHELAHVNDFIPPDSYTGLNNSLTVGQTTSALLDQRVSNVLTSTYPLGSQVLFDLAEVMYFGQTPSAILTDVSAETVGMEFQPDGASDHYGYATQYEDAAMLFENTMMKHFYDVDYEVAFTDAPADERFCNNYIIRWGERGRIGDSNVMQRAQYIVGQILPDLDTTSFFQQLAAPITMEPGGNWCDIMQDSAATGVIQGLGKPNTNQTFDMPSEDLLRPFL